MMLSAHARKMLQFSRSFRVSNRTTAEVMQIGPTRRLPSLRMAAPHSAIATRRLLSSPRIVSSTKPKKSRILTRRTSSTCTRDSEITSKIDAPDFSEFFTVTSGRGLRDEEDEFAQRRCDMDLIEITQRPCEFDVSELAQHAARVVRADRCVNIKEFPGGVNNRTLLLSMDNGNMGRLAKYCAPICLKSMTGAQMPRILRWAPNSYSWRNWTACNCKKFGRK